MTSVAFKMVRECLARYAMTAAHPLMCKNGGLCDDDDQGHLDCEAQSFRPLMDEWSDQAYLLVRGSQVSQATNRFGTPGISNFIPISVHANFVRIIKLRPIRACSKGDNLTTCMHSTECDIHDRIILPRGRIAPYNVSTFSAKHSEEWFVCMPDFHSMPHTGMHHACTMVCTNALVMHQPKPMGLGLQAAHKWPGSTSQDRIQLWY